MRAKIRGLTLKLVMGLVAAATLTGCGDGETPQVLILKSFHGLNPGKDGCTHSERPLAKNTFDAWVSANGGGDFSIFLLLENTLRSNEDPATGRLNSNLVRIDSYEIVYERDEPWGFLPESHVIKTGAVVSTAERLYAPISAIPTSIAQRMIENGDIFGGAPVDLRFAVRARGQLFDGTEAFSNELSFTVAVCDDCLKKPCQGGPIEDRCPVSAQPDAFKCAKTTGGGDGDGTGGTGG